jgi:hypothetical protein
MTAIHAQLSNVQVGHIIHGTYPGYSGGIGSAICLVTEVTGEEIHTRAVTTQYIFKFDRRSGVEIKADGSVGCRLDCIAPLPPEIHAAMLDIDRKYRLLDAPEGGKLLPHEQKAILFAAKHYPANPISDTESDIV